VTKSVLATFALLNRICSTSRRLIPVSGFLTSFELDRLGDDRYLHVVIGTQGGVGGVPVW
jgi:hypothetical protein